MQQDVRAEEELRRGGRRERGKEGQRERGEGKGRGKREKGP